MELLGRAHPTDMLDEARQLLRQSLAVARGAGDMQRILRLRQAQHLPAVEQEIGDVGHVVTDERVHILWGTVLHTQQVYTALAQVYQAIALLIGVALLYRIADERRYGRADRRPQRAPRPAPPLQHWPSHWCWLLHGGSSA